MLSLDANCIGTFIIPRLAIPTQPSCGYVTFYYNNAADLAAATASYAGAGNALCSTASTTTSATAAATTATAVCGDGSSSPLMNPNFECSTGPSVAWVFSGASPKPRIVPSTPENPAYSGDYLVEMILDTEEDYHIEQQVSTTAGVSYTFSIWARLMIRERIVDNEGTHFYLFTYSDSGIQSGQYQFSSLSTESWAQYSVESIGLGSDKLIIQAEIGVDNLVLYVDDATLTSPPV
ncbi:hypothetical protein G7Y89_g3028 [Cudoniella acicularis]|uniref:Uncharacterized protein n=1 Tax=Cudoniella acicularis TaxID=354080 RepID=A0A8H4RT05_9HELO|nr:hypothetical protein G7Y89_g3028 [Cudoniella acicularis]